MKRRKFISIAICLCLLMAMTPAAALAAETEPADQTQASNPSVATEPAQTPSKEIARTDPQPEKQPVETTSQTPTDPAISTETSAPTDSSESTDPSSSPDAQKAEPTEEQPAVPEVEKAPSAPAQQSTAPAALESASAPIAAPEKAAAVKDKKKTAAEATAKVTKTPSGIRVTGGTEGTDWVYDSKEQTLTIKKDGLTISGTATEDLAILCTLAVTTITMENLNNGSHFLMLESADENLDSMTELTIKIKGKNQIDAVVGIGDITLTGTKNSSLDLSLGAQAMNDLNIRSTTVKGGIFVAGRDVNIKGKSVVTAKPTKYISGGDTAAMIMAGRDINIDLAKGGSVTAQGFAGTSDYDHYDRTFPLLAERNINISKNSKVVAPDGGKVGTYKFMGLPLQVILTANGAPATDVSIQHGTWTASASADSVSSMSASPQTGDADSALIYLYVIALAAGAAALIARKKVRD